MMLVNDFDGMDDGDCLGMIDIIDYLGWGSHDWAGFRARVVKGHRVMTPSFRWFT